MQKLRDVIIAILYPVLVIFVMLYIFALGDNLADERNKIFMELCKSLSSVFITIVIGYVALFAGLAAIYVKKNKPDSKSLLNKSIRDIFYFVISSVIMLIFSFLPPDPIPLFFIVSIFIVNQFVFVLLNYNALQFVKKVMSIT
jgi:hypothetical protein